MSHLRLIVNGASQLGEVWSTSFVFDPTGESPSIEQSTLDAQLAACLAIPVPANVLNTLSTSLSVTGLRLEVRDDANEGLLAASEGNYASAQVGVGTPKMPPQCAMVYSLRTQTPGGRGRGRLYWPCLGLGVAGDLRLSASALQTYTDAFVGWVLALRDAIGTVPTIPLALDWAVRSRTDHASRVIKRVQLGNVIDTQRRRRDKMPETYHTKNIQ